jgi:hypothetical protein
MTTATQFGNQSSSATASAQSAQDEASQKQLSESFQSLDRMMKNTSEKIEAANKIREAADSSNKFWVGRFNLTSQGALTALSTLSSVLSASSQPPPKSS